MGRMTATYGIDLASRPERPGVCMIEWREGARAYVHCPSDHGGDQDLLAQMTNEYVTKVGIDAPWGVGGGERLLRDKPFGQRRVRRRVPALPCSLEARWIGVDGAALP